MRVGILQSPAPRWEAVMIKPDMIPDEVVNAAREAWLLSDVNAKEDWRAAIAAALNAWHDAYSVQSPPYAQAGIFLPLPQKGDT